MPDRVTDENLDQWGYCVKCGKLVEWIPSLMRNSYRWPPRCAEHSLEVIKESLKGYGMWPHDWYGHSMYNEREHFYTRGKGWNEPTRFKRPTR